jgi:hypothetical protein
MNVNSALLPISLFNELPITEDMIAKNGKASLEVWFYYLDFQDDINELLPPDNNEIGCGGKDNWSRLGEDFEFTEFNLKAVVESWICDTEEYGDCSKNSYCTLENGEANPDCYVSNTDHTIGIRAVFDGVDLDYWKICDSLDPEFSDCSDLCVEQ